jgi:class 3 adenylate cyclase
MIEVPPVRYARSGDAQIAYQVLGDGETDLLYPNEWGNLTWNWQLPQHERWLRRLAAFSRLVIVDRRGYGLSDRAAPGEHPTLETHLDDLVAVAEDSNVGRPALFGQNETGFMCLLAAATRPDLFGSLILYGASPCFSKTDDMPWELPSERIESDIRSVRRLASNREWAESFARGDSKTLRTDRAALAWFTAAQEMATTPQGWAAAMEVIHRTDLRSVLPSIGVPTLVLHRVHDQRESIESARYLAEKIPDARLVELDGDETLPFFGDSDSVLDEIEEFLTGARGSIVTPDRALVTVLFTDVVDSTARAAELGDREWRVVLQRHHDIVRERLRAYRGVEVDTAGDGFFATFDGAGRAVGCARSIVDAVRDLGIEIRAGVHTGEVERGDKAAGLAVHIGARVMALAGPGEVVVSQTVKDLLVGDLVAFEDAGEHELKGIPGRWRLYRVTPETDEMEVRSLGTDTPRPGVGEMT